MKKFLLLSVVGLLLCGPLFARSENCDGTPEYRSSVEDGYRKLQ